MKKNHKKLLAAAALAALVALFTAVYLGTRPDTDGGAKHISVEVVHSDESGKTFTYDTDEEYLGAVLLAEGLIQGDESEFGLYVTVVDGEEAVYEVDGAYWAFYQGEEYAAQGVDTTPIYDGDTFKLVYTYG